MLYCAAASHLNAVSALIATLQLLSVPGGQNVKHLIAQAVVLKVIIFSPLLDARHAAVDPIRSCWGGGLNNNRFQYWLRDFEARAPSRGGICSACKTLCL